MVPLPCLEEYSGMRPLAGEELLAAWERGGAQPPPVRALTLLIVGFPGLDEAGAAALSVPKRDLALLRLRSNSFGPKLAGFCVCSCCGERLEFTLDDCELVQTLQHAAEAAPVLTQAGYTVRLRLANTADVAAAASVPDLDAATAVLLARCLEATDAAGAAIPPTALPEPVRGEALAQLQAIHAAAELSIALVCPGCGAAEAVALDVTGFLWAEARHAARLLLDEVHTLAWAYGWAEHEILVMSPPRRQAYIERLQA
jgi:hypothetical protein